MSDQVPSGLAAAGRTLWKAVVDDWELSAAELNLLLQICRTVDTLEVLQARLDAADVLDEPVRRPGARLRGVACTRGSGARVKSLV